MLRAEQVPLEVKNAISAARKKGASSAEIAAAAINAWPGMMPVSEVFTAGGDFYRPHLILPLPQEPRDE
jgi:hypothetical protein